MMLVPAGLWAKKTGNLMWLSNLGSVELIKNPKTLLQKVETSALEEQYILIKLWSEK